MSYIQRNKATVRTKQNLIDIAIQEYGTAEALFKLIAQNPNRTFDVDSDLDGIISETVFADEQSDEQVALLTQFDLDNRIIVNEDDLTLDETGDAFDESFDGSFD